jgi:hypothetical protein
MGRTPFKLLAQMAKSHRNSPNVVIDYFATVEGMMKNYLSLGLQSRAFVNLVYPGFYLIRIIKNSMETDVTG